MNSSLAKIRTRFLLGCLASLPFSISLHSGANSPATQWPYPTQRCDSSYFTSYYEPSFNSSCYFPSSSYNPYPSVSYNPSFANDVVLIDLCDLTGEQLFEGYLDQEDTSFVIRCTAGTQFVIDFDLDCKYFHIGDQSGNGNYITFTIDKTFYSCNLWVEKNSTYVEDGEEIYSTEYYVGTFFSDNLEDWETAEDFFGFSIDLKCVRAAPNTLFFSVVKEYPSDMEIPEATTGYGIHNFYKR